MQAPDDARTLRDARATYFADNRFGDDGGYGARWVKVKAGFIPLFLPNIPARVRAVRFHDIHHILTGYDTTWRGEAEVAAWEVATGCAHHWEAWLVNLHAVAIGLVVAPRAVSRAFHRGRHCRNLFRERVDDGLLGQRVGTLRRRLGLDARPPALRLRDRWAFGVWSVLAVTMFATTLSVPIALLVTLGRFVAG